MQYRKMWIIVALCLIVSFLSPSILADEAQVAKEKANPIVIMETSMGKITIECYADDAPITVRNFLTYVREGYYDGLIFHRVIPGFVIQGGGFTPDMKPRKTHDPIKNEATNGLTNKRATLSMARTNVVDSGTSQFFINLVRNKSLDHTSETKKGFGYAVFAIVIEGMDVVDEIAKVKTGSVGHFDDVPKEAVIIEKAYVKE